MQSKVLLSTAELDEHRADPDFLVVDCRFTLADAGKGRRDYDESHIAGAIYAHLDDDLSGEKIPGLTSRHPLPEIETVARTFSGWGIDEKVSVVAYDDAGGALAAARLWWMLRWLGHENAYILDGGWQKWVNEGRPVSTVSPKRGKRSFIPRPHPERLASAADVENIRQASGYRLIDTRAAERFRGENELIDPVAGHIPGARSAPYQANLNDDLTFRSPEQLRSLFTPLIGEVSEDHTIFYCGSGVTSIHSIVAMLHAGFGEARLYAGSWSEWITDPRRPVAIGIE